MLSLFSLTVDSTDEEKNNRFRREKLDISIIEAESKPFIMFIFIPNGAKTNNYLVNKGMLEFDIIANTLYEVEQIYNRINILLKQNYSDMQIISEGQIPSGITSVFQYRVRYTPLVKS